MIEILKAEISEKVEYWTHGGFTKLEVEWQS
jgi:hypothetical protein